MDGRRHYRLRSPSRSGSPAVHPAIGAGSEEARQTGGVASAAVGILFILIAVTIWTAGARSSGLPRSWVWRHLRSSWMLWIGTLLVVNAVSTAAMLALVVVLLVVGSVQVVRGLREFPRVWRLIGDAEAWQGRSGE